MATFRKVLLVCAGLILTCCGIKKTENRVEDELSSWMNRQEGIKVCTTTPLIADTVRQIGGDQVAVISLMGPDLDPHSYEIVKGDYDKLSQAHLIFANGLSLEHSRSMQKILGEHSNVIYVADLVPKKDIIVVNGSPDPHIWMDMELWSMTTFPIEAALIKADPKNADLYRERAEVVRRKYMAMSKHIKEQIQSIRAERRRLVTSHDAFNYFAKQYLEEDGEWQSRVIAIQGLAPDEQISSVEIKRVVEYVKEYDVDIIFAEKNLSQDSILKVIDSCRRSGKYISLADQELYGDTMGNVSYIEMIEHNTKAIVINLKYGNDPKMRPRTDA